MKYCKLMNLRRWSTLTCVLVLSLALAACGDDTETNNGTNNGDITDSGPDGGQVDGGQTDGGQDAGTDADAGSEDGGDADEDATTSGIEIAGVYDSNFDTVETITDDSWAIEASWGDSDSPIITFDNDANWTVTQNADDADFDPGKFNKIVWTEPATDGAFYYCTVTFGEETAEDAENTDQTADDTDPANGGCGGSEWTQLTPMAPQ